MTDRNTLIRGLYQLLPLDNETLGYMVDNALKLPSHSAITEYWLGLLGESPDALDFITSFTSRASTASKAPLRAPSRTQTPKPQAPKPQFALTQQQNRNDKNPWNQPIPAPQKNTNEPRLSKNSGTTTTSQLLDSQLKKTTKQSAKRQKQRKVDNINDLDAILRKLEVQNPHERSVCDCMATRHPLFDIAPNCLNCGKIICAKEGLRPCSFCGKELIPAEEKNQIIALLEAEKQQMEDKSEVKQVSSGEKTKKKKMTISMGAGVDLWKAQEQMFSKLEKEMNKKNKTEKQREEEKKKLEEQNKELQYYANQKVIDPDLLKAKQNLDNLLNFQANSAERTRIIDQASDFELPTGSNLNIWSSGVEKALQLKKQQRQLRKQEKKERELIGRGKRVLDITIGKDGKAVMREVKFTSSGASSMDVSDESDAEDAEEIARLEGDLKSQKDAKAKEDYSSVWDPEKDAKKYEKPKYMGKGVEVSGEGESEYPEFKWDRVQQLQSTDKELEEIVAVL